MNGSSDVSAVYGLVDSFGTLFGETNGGTVYTIDPASGAATLVGNSGVSTYGLAAAPATN